MNSMIAFSGRNIGLICLTISIIYRYLYTSKIYINISKTLNT
jgi:hypothetical protein